MTATVLSLYHYMMRSRQRAITRAYTRSARMPADEIEGMSIAKQHYRRSDSVAADSAVSATSPSIDE